MNHTEYLCGAGVGHGAFNVEGVDRDLRVATRGIGSVHLAHTHHMEHDWVSTFSPYTPHGA